MTLQTRHEAKKWDNEELSSPRPELCSDISRQHVLHSCESFSETGIEPNYKNKWDERDISVDLIFLYNRINKLVNLEDLRTPWMELANVVGKDILSESLATEFADEDRLNLPWLQAQHVLPKFKKFANQGPRLYHAIRSAYMSDTVDFFVVGESVFYVVCVLPWDADYPKRIVCCGQSFLQTAHSKLDFYAYLDPTKTQIVKFGNSSWLSTIHCLLFMNEVFRNDTNVTIQEAFCNMPQTVYGTFLLTIICFLTVKDAVHTRDRFLAFVKSHVQ